MKIFVPYTELQPYTAYSLRKYSYQTKFLAQEDSYAGYFNERWKEAEDFINVEHDVIFWEGAIESLIDCPEIWCAYKRDEDFGIEETMIPTLCLTKFTSDFMKTVPVDWTQYFTDGEFWKNKTEKYWQCCDSWIQKTAKAYNVFPHFHKPAVFNMSTMNIIVRNIQRYQHPTAEYFHEAEQPGTHPLIVFNQYLNLFQQEGLNFADAAYKSIMFKWSMLAEGKSAEDFSDMSKVMLFFSHLGEQ